MRRFLLLLALLTLAPILAQAQSANTLSLRGAPAGGIPALAATGVSTNISINLVPKGTGIVLISGAPIGGTLSGLTAGFVPVALTASTLGNGLIWQHPSLPEVIIPGTSTGAQLSNSPASIDFSYLTVEDSLALVGLGSVSTLSSLRANGSWAAPTKLLAGERISDHAGGAWDGVTFQYTPPLRFLTVTDADSGSLSMQTEITRVRTLDIIALGGLNSASPELTITTGQITVAGLFKAGLVAFASLGTPAVGNVRYCTDCDAPAAGAMATCTSAGTKTGAWAFRVNTTPVWGCLGI